MHNGSIVSFAESQRGTTPNLEIDYIEPRKGMKEAGARPGTILFTGTINEGTIEGHAYIFNPTCGPQAYAVRGPFTDGNRRVVLSGLAPRLDSNCKETGRVPDALRFERLP
jgi:hypothetical protein